MALKNKVAPTSQRFYLPALDGLRLVAFLLVFHRPLPPLHIQPVKSLIERLYTFGWVGVDLFFAISAFLITELLLREHAKKGKISIQMFYIRRILRIWPLYFFILLLAFFVFPILRIPISPPWGSVELHGLFYNYFPSFLVFTHNLAIAIRDFPVGAGQLGILWTLALEEQFYLIWPLTMMMLVLKGPKQRYLILGIMALMPIYFRIIFYFWHMPWNFIYVNPLSRFDAFIFGALAAFLIRDLRKTAISPRLISAVASLVAASILVSLFFTKSFQQIVNSTDMIWMYSLLAIAFAAVIVVINFSHGPLTGLLALKPAAWLGKISYGLYIYQLIGLYLAEVIFGNVGPNSGLVHWAVVILAALSSTVMLAAVSYRLLERPFLSLKQRFTVIANR